MEALTNTQHNNRPRRGGRFLTGIVAICLAAVLALGGCGAGDDGGQAPGAVIIGLTDAPGDFISYTVDVSSLSLTKANGAVVEALPLSTRVDFAQYTDLTEFLTAATIPSGVYKKATLHLDYTSAEIWVEDDNGSAVQANALQDINGNPVERLEVSVYLAGRDALLIAPGIPAHLTLDFDLQASNSVDLSDPLDPTVTIEPVLLADVALEAPKVHRVRGPLKDVDIANSHFDVSIRPFYHLMDDGIERFGGLEVHTDADTVFDIDGAGYQGEAGLQVLDTKPRFTASVVIGDLVPDPTRASRFVFEARQVYAGSSVPGGTLDVVTGTVLARSGDSLTMKGATLIRGDGAIVFNDTVTVQLDASTLVKKQFSLDTPSIDAISVGQHLRVFGVLSNTDPGALELDAGNGSAHMLMSVLAGSTSADARPPFNVDLLRINARPASQYDFSGTGIDAANDADPRHYEVDTGGLDVSGIGAGVPVRIAGFVRPFGTAPADFDARTVVDLSQVRAIMAINWEPASATALGALDPNAITLDLSGAGVFHHMGRAGVRTDLGGTSPVIRPRFDQGVYVIGQGGAAQVHTDFADFVTGLQARIDNGASVRGFVARGRYDDTATTLDAGVVLVGIE